MFPTYDVIIVGAGHAGCEAAAAASRLGARTLVCTMNMNTIAQMSCNPAMGGIAKGQIIREIDALGGFSGIVSDQSMVQFRMLNRSKGPAMWSPRTQNDRMLFHTEWRRIMEHLPHVDFWQEMVTGLVIRGDRVTGVRTGMGLEIPGQTVVITSGTFLNGIIHVGEKQFGGGRSGEKAATGITEQLADAGFESGRMKTGTPPRIDGRTIDYSKLEVQHGDDPPARFSFTSTTLPDRQLPCHIGYTSPAVHDILKTGFDRSPMFNGSIRGQGPRYCPSIEDKIDRFADRDRHQLFVEPEGWDTVEIYLNGFSSSLPQEVQYQALRAIDGFENAKMFRPGYAIEYDFFPPTQIKQSLETKLLHGLFFAGQINGTTGYEEAACQGLIAGANAALLVQDREPLVIERSEGYIGVLIDDLINKGTDEPYRMFTSRAEYRILLRQDNADLRLTPKAHALGLVDDDRMAAVQDKRDGLGAFQRFAADLSVEPDAVNAFLQARGTSPLKQKIKLEKFLSRPEVSIDAVRPLIPELDTKLTNMPEDHIFSAEVELTYRGYIDKEQEQVAKMRELEAMRIATDMDYHALTALSAEARDKLSTIRPASLGQASRISGVSPADISVLMVHLNR